MPNTSGIFADVVVVVDISGSMRDELIWLPDTFELLENRLVGTGVGPNLYGLVVFGGFPSNAVARLVGGSSTDFINIASTLTPTIGGNTEDGYEAISTALDVFTFREGSSRICILITDEDRDILPLGPFTKDSIISKLLANSCKFNTIVNASFSKGAIGVRADGLGLFDDGSGGVFTEENQTVVNGLGSTIDDYITLAWGLGGAAYDLNILRDGGTGATAFTEAFLQNKVQEVTEGPDPPTDLFCNFSIDPATDTFLCDSDELDDPVIDIFDGEPKEFVTFLEGLSGDACVHFRISVFTDPLRTSLLYSAFSLTDQRRWFVTRTSQAPCQISISGIRASTSSLPEVKYLPEVLPAVLAEQQLQSDLSGSAVETPLICGVRYYLTVEAYVVDTFYLIKKSSFSASCSTIKQSFWRDNFDAKNWISSGQGKNDFRISKSSNEALFPSVAANGFGNFAIAWQDHRNNEISGISQNPDIFYGVWEAGRNIFWMSGQGRTDTKALSSAFHPIALTDAGRNFVFSGRRQEEIKLNKCPQPTPDEEPSVICAFSEDESFDIDNTNRDADAYLKARVYEPDAKSSYTIAEDNVISVVEDCVVRFDIVGAPGTFAVRVRGEDDVNWSSWINIDEALPSQGASTSFPEGDVFSAYFIDHDRFVLPWVVPAGNGVRRVCFQILTYFGITKAFCIDVFASIAEVDYKVEFSYDEGFSAEGAVSTFESLPALKHNTEAESNATTTVYIRVTFDEPGAIARFEEIATSEKFSHLTNSDFTFNFIQQGVNDQYGLSLIKSAEGVYVGNFIIQKSDGVFNKDGLCAIAVNVPNPCSKLKDIICAGNDPDALNPNKANLLQDFQVDYSALDSIGAEDIDASVQASKLSRLTDIQSFKQLYSMDDPRFTFGNPKFFIKK